MGNLKKTPLLEMWNNPVMQRIRESIYDGSFRYCRQAVCPLILNDTLWRMEEAERDPEFGADVLARRTVLNTPPLLLNLCNDKSCNLWCPSCRTVRINHPSGPDYEFRKELQARLLEPYLSKPTDQAFTLSITGSGDPFASKVFRELLYTLDGSQFPNMRINLQTNGVLLTPRSWQRMHRIHSNITAIFISIDAGTEATYGITRRGGDWGHLLKNCARLGELRQRGEIRRLRFDFVAQAANFKEMAEFAKLSRELGADQAYFSQLINWGTWSSADFFDQCPWLPDHPQRGEFLEVLRDPALNDPFVDLGNLTDYHREALSLA
jgi:sulfatase maturation enzyme AslB (radical SAM superfamily)